MDDGESGRSGGPAHRMEARAPRGAGAGGLTRLAQALVITLVVTPVTHNALKVALLVPLLAAALVGIGARGGRVALHPSVLLWFAYYVAVGAFFVTRGFVSDAPGAPYVAAIYVAFPLLYLVLVQACHELRLLRALAAAAVCGGMLTCAYMLYYALWALGVVPSALFVRLDETQNIGIHEGWIQMRLYSISGLVFLVPYVLASLVVQGDDATAAVRRRWLWLALVLGLAGTLLAGRKALLLNVALTPVVILGLRALLPAASRRRTRALVRRMGVALAALLAGVAVYLPATGRFDWAVFGRMIASGFDPRVQGTGERLRQLLGLLAGWAEHPLLGTGWGHGTRAVIRSSRPWEYELQYVLLLFSTGVVGWLLYAAGVAWVFVAGARVVRGGGPHALLMLPALAGLVSILLAHASNPYLVAGGNMWMVFLPVALINSRLLAASGAVPGRPPSARSASDRRPA